MKPRLVSSLALALFGSGALAQRVPSLDIGVSSGAARDYYFFAPGHQWGDFYGARVSLALLRAAGGSVGLTALADRYHLDASLTQACPRCDQAFPGARVTRFALGPSWRGDVGRYEVSTSALVGRVRRSYPGVPYQGEDAESHPFVAGDAGFGVRWRRMVVGARAESGVTRSVINTRKNQCYLIDPLPGTTCVPPRHSPSYTRVGLFATYRLQ